jgi:hypothetical protein
VKQTFPGDCTDFDPDSYVGSGGRFFRPVAAEFDGTNTVIEYEPVPMEEMPQRYGYLIDAAQEKDRVFCVYGGKW